MICGTCNGRRDRETGKTFIEWNHGLVMQVCPECKGSGEAGMPTPLIGTAPLGNDGNAGEDAILKIELEASTLETLAVATIPGDIPGQPFDKSETSTGIGGGVVPTIGLLLQLAGKRTDDFSDEDLWQKALEAAIEKIEFPYTIVMPCGETMLKSSPSDILGLPIEDVSCPCGDPNHYVIRFDDIREKPQELRSGEYFCLKCLKPHRATKSKLGQKHLRFKEE